MAILDYILSASAHDFDVISRGTGRDCCNKIPPGVARDEVSAACHNMVNRC